MRLCDRDIIAALEQGRIRIEPPPDDTVISGVSVDLRLGHRFRVFSSHTIAYIDLSGSREEVNQSVEKVMGDEILISEQDTFVLHPGELALAVPQVVVGVDDLTVGVDGFRLDAVLYILEDGGQLVEVQVQHAEPVAEPVLAGPEAPVTDGAFVYAAFHCHNPWPKCPHTASALLTPSS